jgi:alpha-L-rhamnosidase
MKAWVDEGIPRGPNGLWDQNVWQFGDWLDPAAPPSEPANGRTDSTLVADAYLVRVLETIAKVSSLLGETKDMDRYQKDASSARKAFGREYITPSGLLVGDTQTSHALAISFGLFDDKDHVAKSSGRLSHLVHAAKYRIATGFVGTPLITHALSDTGHYQLAYRMLLEKSCPSWLYPITMGATTIWERWDSMLPDGSINPGKMTSFNHYALGSVANWLHKNVGGISPQTPGWQTIRVRPLPGGTITSAKVAYESPYGRIECSWKISEMNDTFSMTLIVPPNSKAVVILPSDWKETQQDGEEKSSLIGSGRHQFSCPYKPAKWPPEPEFARSTFHLEV